MTGAYVAKPDAAVEPPDVPPGWDEDWSFPGPNPPGYTPVYSLNLSASESIGYGGTASITISLRDHVTYATIEPSGCSITWTATIDGESVNLRFSGDPDYASSISSSYSDIGDYWGAEPEIEFELTEDDVGKTITLQGASTVSGSALTNTDTIEIRTYRYAVTVTAQLTTWAQVDEEEWTTVTVVAGIDNATLVAGAPTDWGCLGYSGDPPEAYSYEDDANLDEVEVSLNVPLIKVTALSAELESGKIYHAYAKLNLMNGSGDVTATLIVTDLDTEEVLVDKTKVWSEEAAGFGGSTKYATINTLTGEITSTLFD